MKGSNIHIIVTVLLLTLSTTVYSDDGYKIRIKINGYQDSTLLLTSYYGEKIRLIDTAFVTDNQGEFIFHGEKSLPGGIYMAVSSGKKKLFEFIISDYQHFGLTTDTVQYVSNMKIHGSQDNKVFFEYLLKNENYYQKSRNLSTFIDSLAGIGDDITEYKTRLSTLNEEAVDYKLGIINQNKDLFVSSLLNSMRDIEVPDSIQNSSDSTLAYKYYKSHFWDYIDMSDTCMLRTPMLPRKVRKYFDQLVPLNPDSVIVAIDTVISKARPSEEVVSYLVWYFIAEYQNPKYMGFDKVFVHLVDEYFSREDIRNTTPSILQSLQERANKIRPILLEQPAPNLLLIDTLGQLVSFQNIPSNYTVLFFWDSDCGICGQEIDEINKVYRKTDYDFEVYAINVNSDLKKWKEAIVEKKVPGINVNGTRSATKDFHDLYDIYGTPVIYVLDNEKRIIAKRIGADKLIEFFKNYEKRSESQ